MSVKLPLSPSHGLILVHRVKRAVTLHYLKRSHDCRKCLKSALEKDHEQENVECLRWVVHARDVALSAIPSGAQMSEVKEKPPMYSYIANSQIPRAHWGEMAGANAANKAILDKALADGTIVGYGNDEIWSISPTVKRMTTLVVVHVDGRFAQGAGPVLCVRQCHFACPDQRHEALGQHSRQPLLQLESRRLERRLRARVVLQVKSGRTR